MSSIPTSTSVSESAVIAAPFSNVWHLIKLPDFSKFWSALEKSEWVKGTSSEADVVSWKFKDGSSVEVKQEEHSVGFWWGFTVDDLSSFDASRGPKLTCAEHRSLHHLQRHLSAARALILIRRVYDSRVSCYVRGA
jgi:hypothetical protein